MPGPLRFDPIDEAARQWREHWGAETALPMAAVTSIMRAHQIVLARLNEALAPSGLSYPRYEALMLLFYSRTGALPLGKMGDRLQLHPTSVTSLMDGLEKLGYAQRTRHPTDRRTTLAQITDRGREVARETTTALNAIDFGMAPTGRDDLDALVAVLRDFRAAAGDYEEADPSGGDGDA